MIFVAEVASTFNEQLLSRADGPAPSDDRQRAYLINRDIDAIRGTIIRQTMFAEFEKMTHELAEAGEPLTVECFKRLIERAAASLLRPRLRRSTTQLRLECFRIPHFYRAFYVYKYATGLSAAIALSQRVLDGGQARTRRLPVIPQGGCSKDPLDLLRDAGVDMAGPRPGPSRPRSVASWSTSWNSCCSRVVTLRDRRARMGTAEAH